jgi:putative restriction endonuclease
MDEIDRDTLMRMAAFEHVRRLIEIRAQLTANELKPGFVFDGERIPASIRGAAFSSRGRCIS